MQPNRPSRRPAASLGVIIYELLAGATPFEGKRLRSAALGEILEIIGNEDPPRPSMRVSSSNVLSDIATTRSVEPSKLARVVRGELDWIVMKALEKQRERRYDSAAALGEDVSRYLDSLPVNASPPSFIYRSRKLLAHHNPAFMSAALVVVALCTGVSSWHPGRHTVRPRIRIKFP